MKTLSKNIFLWLVLATLSYQYGASQNSKDSLYSIWNKNSLSVKTRIEALDQFIENKLPNNYIDSSNGSPKAIANLALQSGHKKFQVIGMIYQGIEQLQLQDYDSAIQYFNASLDLDESYAWDFGIEKPLLETGYGFFRKSEYQKAEDIFWRCHSYFEKTEKQLEKANVLYWISKIEQDQGKYESSMNHSLKALEICESKGDKNGQIDNFIVLGIIHVALNNFETALNFYNKSLILSKELNNLSGQSAVLNNIGIIYDKQEKYDSAIAYYLNSLAISKEIRDTTRMAIRYSNLGTMYETLGEFEKARNYHLSSLQIRENQGYKRGLTFNLRHLGSISLKEGNQLLAQGKKSEAFNKYKESIIYSEGAMKIAEEVGVLVTTVSSSKQLYEAYKSLGNIKMSLYYFEIYVTNKEKEDSQKFHKDIIRLDYKFAYEKQAAIDSISDTKEQQLKAVKLRQDKVEKYSLYLILAILFIFGMVMYRLYRLAHNRKKQIQSTLDDLKRTQNQLIQSEKLAAIGVLTAGLAHQINNPLNFIQGASFNIKRIFEEKYPSEIEENKFLFNGLEEGVSRISSITKGLIPFSKSASSEDLICDISDVVKNCLVLLHNKTDNKINIKQHFCGADHVQANPNSMHQVILNLLKNAIEAIEGNGEIIITSERKSSQYTLIISDTGEGVTQEDQIKLFEPFYTTKLFDGHVGLGLYMAFVLLKEANATLSIEKNENKGTSVKVLFEV